ncbi:chalcone isomerase family protein [Colwellia sp. Bg11-12]|uniref:chalcone isomerase family protein n=1 Tax=Colwellia sp. Bg11-12 TaxID=2759817 RepID=UPI0015F59E05|nr:chalcone isomerase family protein [Colwellia sp. Bg11-12]MBA6265316.1 chalcone isomerase family protein [Colwellia sp. Bg11-12]
MPKLYVYLIFIFSLQNFILGQAIAKPLNTLDNIIQEQSYIPIGETTFSILFWDLYKSKLLTTTGTYPIQTDRDKLLYQINYLTGISSKDLVNRTVEQWQHLGVEPELYAVYLPILLKIWPDIEEGDSLSLYVNNNKSVFYFNNNLIGEINQPEFSQLFLDIWLSEKTSEPKLRLELLGIKNDK